MKHGRATGLKFTLDCLTLVIYLSIYLFTSFSPREPFGRLLGGILWACALMLCYGNLSNTNYVVNYKCLQIQTIVVNTYEHETITTLNTTSTVTHYFALRNGTFYLLCISYFTIKLSDYLFDITKH